MLSYHRKSQTHLFIHYSDTTLQFLNSIEPHQLLLNHILKTAEPFKQSGIAFRTQVTFIIAAPTPFLQSLLPSFSCFGHDGLKPCTTYAIDAQFSQHYNLPAPRIQTSRAKAALRPSSTQTLPSPQYRDGPSPSRLSANDTALSSLVGRPARLPCPFLPPAHPR